jgi:NAD(P)-dependent dehydrogenase (short-subunit alcohol dehydrogenase family)
LAASRSTSTSASKERSKMEILKDKVVLITGAGMGLGLAAAKESAKLGAKLALVDYNENALKEAKRVLEGEFRGTQVLTVFADASKEEEVKNYVDATVDRFGTVHGFYNNAGIEGRQASITEYDMSVFKKVIDVNLMGVYYGIRYVLPVMKKQNYGRIVNVASVGGIRGVKNEMPYVASKHAVAGMTKNVALEFGEFGITANAIAPGAILTPMVAEAFREINPKDPKSAEVEYAKANPAKRLGKPEEVASVVCFLMSEAASYVNGQVIAIDGGQSNIYGNV